MKTYENESTFVTNFAKDCKQGIKSNGKFEAVVNGITVVVTGMDNNNASKVTMYKGTLDGVQFTGSITALKKRLNVTYTKEYNRTTEAAKTANTKVVIKSDDELTATAKVANDRIMQALATLRKYSDRYQLGMITNFVGIDSVEGLVLQALQREREAAISLQREREAKEREAKEREAKRLMQLQTQRNAIMAKIQDASAKQDFASVMQLSKELAALK